MKKNRFVVGFGISLAVVMMLSVFAIETVFAQECRLIKITSQEKGLGKPTTIQPETLTATSGDCVFWANISKDMVKVRFYGSQECIVNPVGFDCEGSKKSFVTNYFGIGQSKSIQLAKKGTYNYEIQTKTEPSVKAIGQIIVE